MTLANNRRPYEELIRMAMVLGGHRTKKAAVTKALMDYVRLHQQDEITSLFGKLNFDPTYDYKRQRAKA